MLGMNGLIKQLKAKKKLKKETTTTTSTKTTTTKNIMPTYFGATIVVKLIVLQILVMLQVSGVIQLTFMCSPVMIFVLNIKTDTVCIQVATVFTLVQVLDRAFFYYVSLQTFLSIEIVGWKVQLTTSILKNK